MGTGDPMEIRKIIYITNAIESLNSSIRPQKWTMPVRYWGIILNQFILKFEDNCQN